MTKNDEYGEVALNYGTGLAAIASSIAFGVNEWFSILSANILIVSIFITGIIFMLFGVSIERDIDQ